MSTHLIAHNKYLNGTTLQPSSFGLYRVPFSLYPDNSPVLAMQGGLAAIPDDDVVFGMLHEYTTYQEFVAAMMLAQTLHRSMPMPDLYLPYLPGARQDKPRHHSDWDGGNTGDVLNTRQFTLELIEMAGFRMVHILDPHSKLPDAVGDLKISTYDPSSKIAKYVSGAGYDGIIAPDAGALERAANVATKLGIPLLFGTKRRDPATNELSGTQIKGLHAKEHYLIIDDICDGGGTFIGLGEVILAADATADLYVTHGLFTKGADEKLKRYYNNLYAGDGLGYKADHVTTIPLVEDMMLRRQSGDRFNYYNIEEGKR
jgi:ribose-phosphate pyrophosphokinase